MKIRPAVPARLLALLAFSLIAGRAHAEPQSVRVSVALPAEHPALDPGWKTFSEAVAREAPDRFDFSVFIGGAPIGASRQLEGLRQGEAEMGFIALPDYPEMFPEAAFISELAMLGSNGMAAAAAVTELFLLECEPCQARFADAGLVFLGTYSAAPYFLASDQALTTIDDLRGQRISTPGSLWDRWAISVGGSPVQPEGGGPEVLHQDQADAIIDVANTLQQDKTPEDLAIVRLPLGSYRGASPFTVNGGFWNSLSRVDQIAFMRGALEGSIAITRAYREQSEAALEQLREQGAELVEADPLLDEAAHQFAGSDLEGAVAMAGERLSVEDPTPLVDRFRELYDKYVVLLGPENGSAAKPATVLWEEIYQRLGRNGGKPRTEGLESAG